jgi:primosomal protein N''
MLAQIDSGLDPTREREQRRTMPTVADFAERWLTEHVALKRKPTTAAEYQRIVRRNIEPMLGKLPVDDVALSDALRLHSTLAPQNYLANRVIAVLSAIMTYAERHNLRPPASNPCRGLERFKETKRKRVMDVAPAAKATCLSVIAWPSPPRSASIVPSDPPPSLALSATFICCATCRAIPF